MPYEQWLRPVIVAGTATAAIVLAGYCWRSYQAATKRESEIVVVRSRENTSTSISSFTGGDGIVQERRSVATRIRTSERRVLSQLGDLPEEEEVEIGVFIQAEPEPGRFESQESYGAGDAFEEDSDYVTAAQFSRLRSDSIHPGSASSLLPSLGSNPFEGANRKRVLILGLDGAGKSTLLHQLSNFETLSSRYLPTEGFRVMALATQSCDFDMYEVGGSQKNRPYWTRFLDNLDLLMFIVDGCSDEERLELAADELGKLMDDSRMDGIPLLVVITHQDRLQCLSPDEAATVLGLPRYSSTRHLCRAVGVSLHHGDPPEGIAKLRSWMFPVLARAVELQDDAG